MKYSQYKNHNESTGFLFWQVATLWQRKIKHALQPLNLTHTQYVILAVIEELKEHSENVTQQMISDFSTIDVMTTSSTLRLLEKKKLINRNPNTTDTRAYSIMNTQIGINYLIEATSKIEEIDKDFFSEDTKEFQNQLETLIKINKPT